MSDMGSSHTDSKTDERGYMTEWLALAPRGWHARDTSIGGPHLSLYATVRYDRQYQQSCEYLHPLGVIGKITAYDPWPPTASSRLWKKPCPMIALRSVAEPCLRLLKHSTSTMVSKTQGSRVGISHRIRTHRIHRFIDFASSTPDQLDQLAAACDRATFGRGNEDVVAHRKT